MRDNPKGYLTLNRRIEAPSWTLTTSCLLHRILGMSLWDTIRLLRDQAALIPVVDLKYCEEVRLL